MPFGLEVEADGKTVRLRLGLVDVGWLRPHEEIVYQNYRELFDEVVRSGLFLTPLVVDGASGVILDGTHRLAVAKSLGLRCVPATIVDYSSAEVGLRFWAKLFEGDIEKAVAALAGTGLRPAQGAQGTVELLLVGEGRSLSLIDAQQASPIRFSGFRRAVRRLVGLFGEPKHVGEPRPGRGEFAVVPPPLSKADVVDAGLSRNLFPPKTTRHIFAVRVVRAPTPLWLLRRDPVEVEDEFARMLRKSSIRVLDGKAGYGGKSYDDRKIVVVE